jgi:hypothetical protein
MNDVNGPIRLAQFAEQHNVDLAPYVEALASLDRLGKFIDIEPPFAADVHRQLEAGADLLSAVRVATDRALASLGD